LEAWKAAVKPNNKAFYAETIGNPRNDILDISAVADVAHAAGVPLIVDNTVASPFLCRPLEHGADIVVHSATKFIGGHGTSIGGVIVDGGSFDFGDAERFPGFNDPDESYGGLTFWPSLGHGSFILKARLQWLRDTGAAISPFNAFLLLQGLETLSLRMERHVENAKAVVEFLDGHDQVESVNYAGLASSPWAAQAAKYVPAGAGSVPSFVIKGGRDAGERFANALELHEQLANLGDARSLVVHPGSTTHSQLNDEEQRSAGVEPGLVRLSVGIETIGDIIADLEVGFAAAKA
ncbi:MAG: PLP-dependent transferase, partial [Candidatus Microthrix sp.]|uniref:O-acetylhomoserine aminocarboxypropyltransferase/cysteine synthase family protein n=1 Tax=Candidatus Neomicrothrix sp. TaxID=2719034 RepID=UPI001B6829E2